MTNSDARTYSILQAVDEGKAFYSAPDPRKNNADNDFYLTLEADGLIYRKSRTVDGSKYFLAENGRKFLEQRRNSNTISG